METLLYFVPVSGIDFRSLPLPIIQRIASIQGLSNAVMYRANDLIQYIRQRELAEGGIRLPMDLINRLLGNSIVQLPDGTEYILAGTEIDPLLLQDICKNRPCRFLRYLEGTLPTLPRPKPAAEVGEITSRLAGLQIGPRIPPGTRLVPTVLPAAVPSPRPAPTFRPTVLPPAQPVTRPPARPPQMVRPPFLPQPPQVPPPPPPPLQIQIPPPEEIERLKGVLRQQIEILNRREKLLQDDQAAAVKLRIQLSESGVPEKEIDRRLFEINPIMAQREKRFFDYSIFINAERNRIQELLQILENLDSIEKVVEVQRRLEGIRKLESQLRPVFRK